MHIATHTEAQTIRTKVTTPVARVKNATRSEVMKAAWAIVRNSIADGRRWDLALEYAISRHPAMRNPGNMRDALIAAITADHIKYYGPRPSVTPMSAALKNAWAAFKANVARRTYTSSEIAAEREMAEFIDCPVTYAREQTRINNLRCA